MNDARKTRLSEQRRASVPPAKDGRGRAHDHGILAFLLLAFGLAWFPFLPTAVGGEPIGEAFMPIVPALAAIIVRQWITHEGFADAGLRPALPHGWPFYLLAAGWPLLASPLAVVLAMVLHLGPTGLALPWGLASPQPLTLVGWMVISMALAPLILGEELGWRGYLETRWFPGRPLAAAVAVGLVWGIWHYPMLMVSDVSPADKAALLLLYPAGTVVSSVFLGWLRRRTGDIWAGSLAHATNNSTQYNLNQGAFTGGVDGPFPLTSSVPILLAEALVLVGIVSMVTGRRRAGAAPLGTGRRR